MQYCKMAIHLTIILFIKSHYYFPLNYMTWHMNTTKICQQRRIRITHFNERQKIPHFFPRYINFPKFSEIWPWINWIWNQSKWEDYYYTVLFAKSLSHYFSFFLIVLSFFPSPFCEEGGTDNYFLNCWELFSCYLRNSAVASDL